MRISFRAAAAAAVAIGLCATAGFAGPSLASEAPSAPTISYIGHASTPVLTADNLGLNEIDEAAEAAEAATAPAPVATHVGAPVLPEPETAGPAEETEQRNGRSLSQLVEDFAAAETPDQETDCLARAVYYESKGEPLNGQLTVADVIINRSRSGRFASTICGVVRQPGQFSFVRRGHIPTPPAGSRQWRVAVAIARIAMQDLADGGAPRALFFHARRVNPRWRHTRVATIGNHVFYR